MEIPKCVTAYNGNPYMRYRVQLKSLSPIQPPGPGKIHNPNPLLRTMEVPIFLTTYN